MTKKIDDKGYYNLVEKMREKIITDIKKLASNNMRNFSLFLKINNAPSIHITKISKFGLIESIDANTEIIHSFEKISLDLLAVVSDCLKDSVDDTDEKIDKVMQDLSDRVGKRGF